jgi:hypothetical protein
VARGRQLVDMVRILVSGRVGVCWCVRECRAPANKMDPIDGGRRLSPVGGVARLDGKGEVLEGVLRKVPAEEAWPGKGLSAGGQVSKPAGAEMSGEQLAAQAMFDRLKIWCKKWAPEGADFEFRHPRSSGLVVLLEEKNPARSEAVLFELLNPDSPVFYGRYVLGSLETAAEEAEATPAEPYILRLLADPRTQTWYGDRTKQP